MLTVTDLETKIKEQAGLIAIAELQIRGLLDDNATLKAALAAKSTETSAPKRKGHIAK